MEEPAQKEFVVFFLGSLGVGLKWTLTGEDFSNFRTASRSYDIGEFITCS